MIDSKNVEYLGDGAYVQYTGYSIILKANDFNNPTDVVELGEPEIRILINLMREWGILND